MKHPAILWLCLLAGPAIWFLTLNLDFVLAPSAWKGKAVFHLVSLVALIIIAIAGWISWNAWRELKNEPGRGRRAVSIGGVVLNAMFVLVIIAHEIPNLVYTGHE